METNFSEQAICLFLQLIKNKGSVLKLIEEGFSYSQIAQMLNDCIIRGLIVEGEDSLEITAHGKKYLEKRRCIGTNSIIALDKYRVKNDAKLEEFYLPGRIYVSKWFGKSV